MVKIATVSLGCPKNLVDSEVMLGTLQENGYIIINEPENAEVIIINTCGFIESAKKESIDTIVEFAQYKKNKCQVLIVTGCLVQRYKDELTGEIPEIDGIMGTGDYDNIIQCIDNNLKGVKYNSTDNMEYLYDHLTPRLLSTPKYTAYLKIAEGCDNHCTYCIIPSLRGKYRSRSIESIVTEAKSLAKNGVKEIILIAQDTTVYGLDLDGNLLLPKLLEELNEIQELKWIRLMYCYPTFMTDELIQKIKSLPKVCNYIDIPLQHGDDNILKSMGRKETRQELIDLVKKLRSNIPDVAIRTSLIVGFPGEQEEHFNNLVEFVKEIQLDRVGVFTYSKEDGTAAAKLKGQVNQRVKVLRQHKLMKLQQKISSSLNAKSVGKIYEVLVEGINDNGQAWGRTYKDSPEIDGKVFIDTTETVAIGDFIPVKIVQAMEYDLIGEKC
ncbi:30S ribosomal protein S12 methylthiotransferase RimO [Alkalicella caledoniensis]|uniref:Ribosomal protein uS12 methylthiotransferase RimO n=2 Tax=Alkalicella caledoniensis TaxID=2731377 RepID=A0A7G9WCS9_ALKCA|nr:30S ribosomal protein S12 methylthiotransferase RimO [Alkalicella caledoniensis]QNO16491.1 30S ribosomal protein S12 methylthiotransferase RimO [Alkalicella caledoniensis]